ncbi:MAG: small GTP-binding domain protein [Candidatus Lokiarchaeum sp. GC14_75]|nr:MAG: small GTP-binding domain protein [Candidatus Lokiarchaeum sp. GC14_75]
MSRLSIIEDLLGNLLKETKELVAALVLDLDGFLIAKSSIKGFDEDIITAITSILEQTINKIKKYTETTFGSGTFGTNEFQLFYIDLSKVTPAIFVLVGDQYSNINQFIPYAYIVAEKISSILNNRETSIQIPRLDNSGDLILHPEFDSNFRKKNISKIVIIGSESVGKSSLVDMYCRGEIEENYKPTIGISIVEKKLQISKSYHLMLYLLDLGGLKSFAKIRKFYYSYSNIILILFDFTNIETLNNVKGWIEESRLFIKDKSIPILLIGNKIDLIDSRESIRSQAQDLAAEYNFPFFETSALTGEGIDELFTFMISTLF